MLKKIRVKYARVIGSRFEALGVLESKIVETDPHFFLKKIRVCFLQLFDPSTPKASNRDPNSRNYFMRNIFIILAP